MQRVDSHKIWEKFWSWLLKTFFTIRNGLIFWWNEQVASSSPAAPATMFSKKKLTKTVPRLTLCSLFFSKCWRNLQTPIVLLCLVRQLKCEFAALPLKTTHFAAACWMWRSGTSGFIRWLCYAGTAVLVKLAG